MKLKHTTLVIALSAAAILSACGGGSSGTTNSANENSALTLLTSAGAHLGLSPDAYHRQITEAFAKYPANWHVFMPSALSVDFKTQLVKLPLYKGRSPAGSEYYIITEASDFETAKQLGVNYAPKLSKTPAAALQTTSFDKNGELVFEGTVNFNFERSISVNTDAPQNALKDVTGAQPGSVGDAKYSPLVKLPNGVVLNISYVSNATGAHPHVRLGGGSVDMKAMTASLGFLDGFQGGSQYYFHLVTDANDPGPAAIEGGTYAPRLAAIKTFGQDLPSDNSPLLGFSPVGDGMASGPNQQGLNSLIYNYQLDIAKGVTPTFKPDPINVFPLQPTNGVADAAVNNYSPLWDAHISAWGNNYASAVRIKSLDQVKQLVAAGTIGSLAGAGTNGNLIPLVPNGLIIDCPVIAQPDESVIKALQ